MIFLYIVIGLVCFEILFRTNRWYEKNVLAKLHRRNRIRERAHRIKLIRMDREWREKWDF